MRRRLQAAAGRRHLLELAVVAEMIGSLLRTIVLARILAPDQFGIAVALALVVAMIEMMSDIGLERSIVRMGEGMAVSAQRDTLHALAVIRGLLLALLLLAAAPFFARLFDAPEATTAFAALAVCAAVRGFAHLGTKELARVYDFGPDGLASLSLQLVTNLGIILLAWMTRSYQAVAIGLILGQLVYVALTHLLAPQPWRLGWHGEAARWAWRYGAPLIPNGITLAVKNIGDRMVAGAVLGPATLALFSVTVMIGLLPRSVVLRYCTTVFLPRFVNTGSGAQGRRLVSAFAILLGLVSAVIGIGMWALGQPVIGLLFGAAYLPPQGLVGAVAIMVAVKILVTAVTAPALAFGATRLILIGSAGSSIGVALGALALMATHDLVVFVNVMTLVDVIALVISVQIGREALAIDRPVVLGAVLGPLIVLAGLAALSAATSWLTWPWRIGVGAAAALLVLAAAAGLVRRAGSSPGEILKLLRSKPPAAGSATGGGEA